MVIAGALAQRPWRGGHAWVFLQYLLGFERLGYDVLFVDRLDASTHETCRGGLDYVRDVMNSHGLDGRWSVLLPDGASVGLDRAGVAGRLQDAILVDVMGYLGDAELLALAARRVFLDIDPGFGQMWQALGQAELYGRHDAYATVGGNLGRDGCLVPDIGIQWTPTLPPVVLEAWPVRPVPEDAPFRTVATWRGPFDAVDLDGERYGVRAHEFRAYASVPATREERFEIALEIDDADEPDRQRLLDGGWRLVDPLPAAGRPDDYRTFLQGGAGEILVAKAMYVRARTGWFSDRSACVLASGRPVLAQDTALEGILPSGDGLLLFRTPAQLHERLDEVADDPGHHRRAARDLAEEHLDSDVVLPLLLEGAA